MASVTPSGLRTGFSEYDVAVIGAGAGGITAAVSAARWGARTILVEKREHTGGDCTWHGCVPSKALLRCAKAAAEARESARFGVSSGTPTIDYAVVRAHFQAAQKQIYEADDSPEVLRAAGVEVHTSTSARFLSAHELVLTRGEAEARICARRLVLCVGSDPRVPPLPGLDKISYRTSDTVWHMEHLPQAMLVLGAGPIGVELAQAYARLGVELTLVGRVLPREPQEARDAIKQALQADGVRILEFRATEISISRDGPRPVATVTHAGGTLTANADEVMVAAGRTAVSRVSSLKLEAAGYSPGADEAGIAVDSHLCVRGVPHALAVGDCIGKQQFTHLAVHQGGVAGWNAAMPKLLWQKGPDEHMVPRCTFTEPEVASVGLSLQQAKQQYSDAHETRVSMSHVDRAVCDGYQSGFVSVAHRGHKGRVLGATVVGHGAGEMLSELALAIHAKLDLSKIVTTMHPYPSMAFGLQVAAGRTFYEWVSGVVHSSGFGLLRLFTCSPSLRGGDAPAELED